MATCLYIVVICTAKAAILLQWLRIFVPNGIRNIFFWACHVTLWINVAYYVAMLILQNLRCTPIQRLWDPLVDGTCITDITSNMVPDAVSGAIGLAAGSINVISDALILLLPQKVIWSLQLDNPRKLGVSVIFAMGLL